MTKRKLEDKNSIVMDRDTYRKLLTVYKHHTAIPGHEKIKIFVTTAKEVKNEDGNKSE